MTAVGDHGLTCLDASSYAAIPLGLQANAQAINDSLVATSATMTAYGNKKLLRFVGTGSTIFDSSGTVLADGTAAGSVISANLGVLPRGWYSASGSLSYQATGAVTAGTYRRSIIQVNLGTSRFPPTFFQATTVETNTGAPDSMTVNGWFYSDQSVNVFLQLMFGHNNTGSSISVPAGAVLTVRFLTTGLVT